MSAANDRQRERRLPDLDDPRLYSEGHCHVLPPRRESRKTKTLLQRAHRWISFRRRIRGMIASRRYALPEDVRQVYLAYAGHPEAKHIVGLLDAGVIYQLVQHQRPKHLLDLGSGLGASTAMAGLAMERNGVGRITAIENLAWLKDLSEEQFPADCKKRTKVLLADVEIRMYLGRPWTCYKLVPDARDVDFVIIDGPPTPPHLKRKDGQRISVPDGDLLAVLPQLRPGCRVFIDGRNETVDAYMRHLSPWFAIKRNRLGYTLMDMVKPFENPGGSAETSG